ncbi:unnamed protein product [Pseudo-nitzschia multistriata]|uniref:Pseudouridine synthase RsuA/RluA-like domain-containing protein n=1 Tax=Pseudo-nitzschia multistriata TaxID=183589 RepID=A0A448YZA8_9STRA|nr:unnamed protein product [Pseudo-nitzschia multistriata]
MKGLNKFGNDDKANASTFVLIIVIALNLIGGVEGMLHPLKYAEPETLFPVLFESKRVLVVRKPHGIGHHDESSSFAAFDNKDQRHEALSTPGVLRLLRSERQRQRDEEGERLYGVHRLDKVTSGILVLAKDTLTASTLSEYFTSLTKDRNSNNREGVAVAFRHGGRKTTAIVTGKHWGFRSLRTGDGSS